MIENFPRLEVMPLKNMLMYAPGQSLSKTFVDMPSFSMHMYSLWHDGEIQTAVDGRDSFITCLEGALIIVYDQKEYAILREGETILLNPGQDFRAIAKVNCKFVVISTQ